MKVGHDYDKKYGEKGAADPEATKLKMLTRYINKHMVTTSEKIHFKME
jgi:hypothetical protein